MTKTRVLIIFTILACVLSVSPAWAQETPEDFGSGAPTERQLSVPIPDGSGGVLKNNNVPPGVYINTIYRWGIGLAALLALGQLVLGGVLYTLSAGSLANREAATERMKNSVTGLILLIAGATLLITINPKLANLSPIDTTGKIKESINNIPKIDPAVVADASGKGPSKAAALAARDRLDAIPQILGDSTCQGAANKMTQEIYEFAVKKDWFGLSADDEDIHEVIDDKGTGIFQDSADFLEYMEDVTEEDEGSYEANCYRDAVIFSLRYAKDRMSAEAFAILVTELEKFPAALMASEYLKSDPFGRASITAKAALDQRIEEVRASFSSYWQGQYAAQQAHIDASPVRIDEFVSNMTAAGLDSTTPKYVTISLFYAKEKLSAAKYKELLQAVKNKNITAQLPSVYIPK